jgi:hypothetical protein
MILKHAGDGVIGKALLYSKISDRQFPGSDSLNKKRKKI